MFSYDVFLSHAAADAADADRVRAALIAAKFRVYCDRYDDPQLDRSKVSRATAEVLRDRMRASNAMVYVVTANASASKWMPWEVGFFDGARGKVLVYPVDGAARRSIKGLVYLDLCTILEPGSLEDRLREEIKASTSDAALGWETDAADPPAPDFMAVLKDAQLFGPADYRATADYRGRMLDASRSPTDLNQVLQVQADIWRAWLSLWGLGDRSRR